MKRIIVLALAACMVLGAALGASAAEFKASGMLYAGYNYSNADDYKTTGSDLNEFSQRFRSQIDIVTDENLSGTLYFEIDQTWGKGPKNGPTSGGDLGADDVNIETRRAYMTFMVPNTAVKVRAGIQGLSLPGAVSGSPILADDVAAIVASTSFDNVGVTGFFARPYDTAKSETTVDFFGAIVAADFGTVSVSPYFMFANVGNNAAAFGGEDAQWYGVAVEAAPIENLTLAFDGMYGKVTDEDGGFLVAGKAAYATDFAVPAFVVWYGSGNDDDGEGIMPTADGLDFTTTTFVGFGATGTSNDSLFGTALGKWGVSLQASELTFLENVTHTVRLSYIQGTNEDSSDLTVWGDDDRAYEFDFVTVYSAYPNLDFIVDLAYAGTDFDGGAAKSVDNVYKAALGVQYNF
jgi:hypothetical protein